jgi:mannose-6-phosphate isomerase-like protein (cupin superfamily)
MRLWAMVLAVFGSTFASCKAMPITTYSTSPFRTVIAEATVPDRQGAPLYFSVWSGVLSPKNATKVTYSDDIYYQYLGTTTITLKNRTIRLMSGYGIYLSAGTKFTVKADGSLPSTYLEFLLSPNPAAESSRQPAESAVEVYHSLSPIPGLMPERNFLSLSKVSVPPEAPCDPLHQRSGAALHYVLSGVGAEFTEMRAKQRGPGSVSYEPRGYAYHWSNPGATPLVYLVFNVSPEDLPPVVKVDESANGPLLSNSHVTWAIYCVALSMILTFIVCAMTWVDPHQIEGGNGSGKRWRKK